MTIRATACSGIAAFLVIFCPRAGAQTAGQKNPPLVIQSLYGRDLFEFYCAPCHGQNGKATGQSLQRSKRSLQISPRSRGVMAAHFLPVAWNLLLRATPKSHSRRMGQE